MFSYLASRMEWEKPYLEALIDQLRPFGRVLEVGFALGVAAERIQTHRPKEHIIIERNPDVAAEAVKWAALRENVTVIQESWERALPQLGVFDAIFFNDFDPESVARDLSMQEMGNQVVQRAKELVARIGQDFPQMTKICYTDTHLDELLNAPDFDPFQMTHFLRTLVKNGQISEQQMQAALSKLRPQERASASAPVQSVVVDCMFAFLKRCLNNHMRKGSRFTCFSLNPLSKFEHSEFFDQIITNPNVDYQEKTMPVDVPASCSYYKHKEALIMTLEKQV